MTNLPLSGTFRVTCEYGRKGDLWKSGYHKGIDLYSDNRNVYCTCDGIVKTVGYDKNGWGYYVRVENKDNKNIHISCHFAKDTIKVKVGQKVNRSTVLAKMGTTGNSTGVHLHFQVEKSNTDRTVINPTKWLGIPNKVGTYNSKDYEIEVSVLDRFKDKKKVSDWAKTSVEKAVKKGVLKGSSNGELLPQGNVTREQMAVILDRLGLLG